MTATIQTREIQYTAKDGTQLVGYFAAPVSATPVAGIIVAPEWWGRTEYAERRARELAEHGYAALAIDMYGDKKVTHTPAQAQEWMGETFQKPETIVVRAGAGLEALAAQPEVDATRLAGIGFCYGGKIVLDLARSGADLKAAVSFHGTLSTQTTAKPNQITAKILVLHGVKDSMISLQDVAKFEQEMRDAHADYKVIVLEDAKHGFSNPVADEHAKANGIDLGYNAQAEQQSLAAMYALLERTL